MYENSFTITRNASCEKRAILQQYYFLSDKQLLCRPNLEKRTSTYILGNYLVHLGVRSAGKQLHEKLFNLKF